MSCDKIAAGVMMRRRGSESMGCDMRILTIVSVLSLGDGRKFSRLRASREGKVRAAVDVEFGRVLADRNVWRGLLLA